MFVLFVYEEQRHYNVLKQYTTSHVAEVKFQEIKQKNYVTIVLDHFNHDFSRFGLISIRDLSHCEKGIGVTHIFVSTVTVCSG